MPRLFVGNFSFEDARDPGRNSTQQVKRLEAELACLWLAVAEDGDEILCPALLSDAYWDGMADMGCPRIRPLMLENLPSSRSRELVPWGWTPLVRGLAERLKSPIHAPDQELIWQVNSREFAFEICQKLDCTLPGEGIACSLEEALSLISEVRRNSPGWIVKPNHGQAGRGQVRGTEIPIEKELSTLTRLISRQGVVHVEPFLESVLELGAQWQIPPVGTPQCLGLTQLFTDARGIYSGSGVNVVVLPGAARETLLETQFEVVTHLQAVGYFGPVGIDAMLFRHENEIGIRAVQDINARWTMGRIAWEWGQRANQLGWSGSSGNWLQSAESPQKSAIALSPGSIQSTPVRARTWWVPHEKFITSP